MTGGRGLLMRGVGLGAAGFAFVQPLQEQDEEDADADGDVRNVEDREVVQPPVEVEEIDHIVQAHAVDEVADDAADEERAGEQHLRVGAEEFLPEEAADEDGDRAEECQPELRAGKHTPRGALVAHVGQVEEGKKREAFAMAEMRLHEALRCLVQRQHAQENPGRQKKIFTH